jgi:OHCU decarboxylase
MLTRSRNAALALIAGAMLTASAVAASAEADMNAINGMDRAAFVQKFGGIFEKSPWVAEKAWDKKPFASIDDMHAAMVNVVKYAPVPSQLALLQSHPDLAGKEAQAGAMTASSVSEQASAGLNALSKAEMTQISDRIRQRPAERLRNHPAAARSDLSPATDHRRKARRRHSPAYH